MRTLKTTSRLSLALCATALTLAAAAPALAQSVDELTVVGHRGPDGRANTLSRAVDISDLDLRRDADVREMQFRVRSTARSLCEELGETGGPGLTPSCIDTAVRGAQRQTRIAVAQAREPTYYAYAAPPPPAYAPYVGDYAPPASAVEPQYYPDGTPYAPPEL
jgi:UrcA family protein